MLSGLALNKYLNKVVNIKTKNGLYIRLTDVSEKNVFPTIDLVDNKTLASEFILTNRSDTNIVIRLNVDMLNQNGTFGYHLYVLPNTDLLYGAGNSELFAQFVLEQLDNYVMIKSAYKQAYLCHEYNVIRARPLSDCNNYAFTIETSIVPIIQNSICIVSYGFLRKHVDIDSSPIIDTLKKVYPESNIDVYMYLPDTMDEFYNVKVEQQKIQSSKCNLNIKLYPYDIKHFMKIAHFHGFPLISEGTKIYPYRTLSMFWNISESIKYMQTSKKYYHIYILMRNDSFLTTDILCKQIDRGKTFCLNNDVVDSHLIVGRDLLKLEYLYDFYIKNKRDFQNAPPNQIITQFLKINKITFGDLRGVAPINKYELNTRKTEDKFYRAVYEKYREIM